MAGRLISWTWLLSIVVSLALVACGDDDPSNGTAGGGSPDGGGVASGGLAGGDDNAAGIPSTASGGGGDSDGHHSQGGNDAVTNGGAGGPAQAGGGGDDQSAGNGGGGSAAISRVCSGFGTDCLSDADCFSNAYCADFKCTPAPATGSPCLAGRCEEGARCVSGQCQSLIIVALGDECGCPTCQCAQGLACEVDEGTEVCQTATPGEGENCGDAPCDDGFYCHEIPGLSPPECRRLDAEGEHCGETASTFPQNTCRPGLYCDEECTPQFDEGEPCSGTEQCRAGLYCNANLECTPSALGTPCGNDSICGDGSSTCSAGTCRAAAGAGAPCNLQKCADGTHCNEPYTCHAEHTCHLPIYTCVAELPDGEGCDEAACRGTSLCLPVNPGGGLPSGDAGQVAAATQVAAGNYFTCALLKDQRVKCWGRNFNFQVGADWSEMELVPVSPLGLQNAAVLDLSVGDSHACALLANGELKCWGDGGAGQLGISIYTQSPPSLPVPLGSPVLSMATGGAHSCALLAGGNITCWGDAQALGLGIAVPESSLPQPGPAIALPTAAVAGATGGAHICGLLGDGTVVCGGSNYYGQLGLGTQSFSALPGQAVTLGSKAIAIAAGSHATYALLENGQVVAWGLNQYGVLGTGDTDTRYAPVGPLDLGGKAVAVDASFTHACALLETGQIKCWGGNQDGQLGVGDLEPRLSPVSVDQGEPASAIAVGFAHTCALFSEQRIKCWGSNESGELGLRDTVSRGGTPATVPRLLEPIRL